jgi:hypothetical protein
MVMVNDGLRSSSRHSGTRVFAWTRNLEIPGSRFARPGMTASYPLFRNPAEMPLMVI